jgi:hypothetical protein
LSSTLRQGKSANDWKTTPRSGPGPLTTRSSTRIRPAVGARKPAIVFSIVVLPHPEGPTTETKSPASTVSEMSRIAVTWRFANGSK